MVLADQWQLDPVARDRVAQRTLDTLDQLDPQVGRGAVPHLRGQALRVMERYADAIGPLREASSADPENMHIYLALGWCYKRIGRLDMAIESLEDALANDPDEGILHYNLACYWSLVGKTSTAVRYLGQAFDLDPNYRDMVAGERDFDPIRSQPEFLMLTSVIV